MSTWSTSPTTNQRNIPTQKSQCGGWRKIWCQGSRPLGERETMRICTFMWGCSPQRHQPIAAKPSQWATGTMRKKREGLKRRQLLKWSMDQSHQGGWDPSAMMYKGLASLITTKHSASYRAKWNDQMQDCFSLISSAVILLPQVNDGTGPVDTPVNIVANEGWFWTDWTNYWPSHHYYLLTWQHVCMLEHISYILHCSRGKKAGRYAAVYSAVLYLHVCGRNWGRWKVSGEHSLAFWQQSWASGASYDMPTK